MNFISLSGKYINLRNVVSIEEPQSGGGILYIHYITGGRDGLATNSPEAAALRWWLERFSVDIMARQREAIEAPF